MEDRPLFSKWVSTLLSISYHVFDLVLAGIESTSPFLLSYESGVSKLTNDINLSTMTSSSVSILSSLGKGLIGSNCKFKVSSSRFSCLGKTRVSNDKSLGKLLKHVIVRTKSKSNHIFLIIQVAKYRPIYIYIYIYVSILNQVNEIKLM